MPSPAAVPSLSVVMPAFNEAENLPTVVGQVAQVCRRLYGAAPGFELVIVDDGSVDGTAAAISALAAQFPEVRSLTHERNQGLTAALRTGYFAAAKEYVLFIPADGQIPAEAIPIFMAAAPNQDVVLSHYRHRPDGIVRAVMSKTLRLLLRVSLGLGDRSDGSYLFRRSLLDQIPLVAARSAGSIGFELCAKARRAGCKITSVTIECAPRLSGRSKVAHARSVWEYLGEIYRIRRSMKE